jgi:N-acetylglutamate synthase
MLGPRHIGKRVSVRVRLAEPAPGRRFRDVTGELVAADESRLRVLPESGPVVAIDVAAIVAARTVPPKPTPFSEIVELERLLAASWPPLETSAFAGWEFRAAAGFTRRANTVLALVEPAVGVDEALDAAARWFGERGLRPRVQISGPVGRRLDGELAERGWIDDGHATVLVKSADAREPLLEVSHEPDPVFLERVGRGQADVAARVLGSGPDRGYVAVREGETPVAWGRAALAGDIAAITSVGVAESHRRHGLGGQVMDALEAWGGASGATRIALQVETGNAPALELYRRRGYQERYRYWYRERPTGG